MFLDGIFRGGIDIAEVSVPCPCLFSLAMAKTWKIETNHARETLYLGRFDYTLPFVDGVPYVNVFEFKTGRVDKTKVSRQFLL